MNPLSNHTSITSSSDTDEHNQQHRSKRGGCKYPFPQRLFDLLEKADDGREPEELSSIISWNPNGKHFRVHNRKAFEQIIQKKHFNQSKYASFRRQLNLWGFERIADQQEEEKEISSVYGGCYFHPLFQRNDRSLCCTMSRAVGRDGSKKLLSKTVVGSTGGSRFSTPSYCSTSGSDPHDENSNASQSLVTTSSSGHSYHSRMENQPCSSFPTPVSSLLVDGLDGVVKPYDLLMHDSMTLFSTKNQEVSTMDANILSFLLNSNVPQEESNLTPSLGVDILLEQQQQRNVQDKGDDSSPTIVDDKEFQELIAFLSADDDNIQRYLLES